MGTTPNLWTKFDNFCITRLQYSPTTLDERKRKLRHLQNKGVDLVNFDPEEVYTYFANRIKQGTPAHSLNHYIKALNAWIKFRDKKVWRGVECTWILSTDKSQEKLEC